MLPESRPKKTGRPLDAAKRNKIIEAAAQSFFCGGFAGTAIEQVAADAGVSKVTIYNQFGDKRALFTAAVESECEKVRGYFSLEQMPQGSIRERLTAIGEAMLAFLHRPEMIQFERRIAAETVHDPAIGAVFLEAGPNRMKQAFAAWLRHACETGELQIADTLLAAEQFVALCKGMGDLEHRFGVAVTSEASARRVSGAVEVFLAAYAAK
jgi:TetR/AcrR family transcriptional regulator, mexJK operon transcriptional repressor